MNGGAPDLTLAERFRTALDACDRAYVRGDATPVILEARPRPEVRFEAPQLASAPQLLPAPQVVALSDAPAAIVPKSGPGVLRTIAIVAGVIVLALGAWFVRKRLVEPLFYGRGERPDDDDKSARRGDLGWEGYGKGAGKGGKGWEARAAKEASSREAREAPELRPRRAARVAFEEPPRRALPLRLPSAEPSRAAQEAQRLLDARQETVHEEPEVDDDDPNFEPL